MASRKIWNGRVSGIASAIIMSSAIFFRRAGDHIATLAWRGNLGALGPGSRIQRGVSIRYPGSIRIGARTSVAKGVEMATELDGATCRIGCDVIVGQDVRLDFSGGLVIGDNVVISEQSRIFTHAHGLKPKSIPAKAPLEIEADVWIGSRVTVVEGVARIGRGAIVATGTVLTKEVPPGVLVAGVPGRVIRKLS